MEPSILFQVQSFFFGIRKDVFEYDQVLDQQRQLIYGLRGKALLDSDAEVLRSLQQFCEETLGRGLGELLNNLLMEFKLHFLLADGDAHTQVYI